MPAVRVSDEDRVDALFVGTVFLDIVLSGLDAQPHPGEETWATRRAVSPGGMANNAVGAARLGMRTALVTAVGTDPCGDLVWGDLSREDRLDLSWSRRVPSVETALTVAISDADDRSLISHGKLDPVPVEALVTTLPRAGACFFSLRDDPVDWVAPQRRAGALIFAGVGWEGRLGWPSEADPRLADVDAVVVNESEALACTGAANVRDALHRIGERVPLAVITLGAQGALALDSGASLEVTAAPVRVEVRDTTGAGDEFVAGLMHGTLAGLPLADRLRYANLCAALSVRGWGGAASAPTIRAIADWHHSPEEKPTGYGFLGDFLDSRRAAATGQLH